MGVSFQFNINTDRFREAVKKAPEAVQRNIKTAMIIGMKDVKQEAQRTHRFTSRSNDLERSIEDSVNASGSVGKVELDTRVAHYGPYQHEGTKDHPVTPKRKKALRFVSGGQFGFSKGHNVSGIKRDPFLDNALERKGSSLQARLEKAITDALEGLQ